MLDVSDVLTDPDMVGPLSVTRYAETVDGSGRMQESATVFQIFAAVTPATEELLERLPEADRSSETIALYTATRLTAGDDAHGPDVVSWQGGTYQVRGVWDWSVGGFFEVLAISNTMQGKAV